MIAMSCGNRTIQLPNPDLRDHKKVEQVVAFKVSMSGKLYGKALAPRPTVFVWTFSSLTRLKSWELSDFIDFAAGKVVRLFDSDDAQWYVKVSQPSLEVDVVGRGNGAGVAESASVTIELEGSRIT